MTSEKFRADLIATIVRREQLRPLTRFQRLRRNPLKTSLFYILASLGHITPYKLRFPTLWGTIMTCYLPEGNTFYYYGYCEANLTNFFIRLLKNGNCFLDIGAHVGFYSMLASMLVGQEGRVVGFEPTPWTYQLLQENVGNLSNVEVLNQALADRAGVLTFSDYGPGYGAYNSVHANWGDNLIRDRAQKKTCVTATTLDDYCRERALMPNVIKIDTEGFEHQVLLGGEKLLSRANSRQRPIVSIEMAGGREWESNQLRAVLLLQEWGYQPHEISPDGHLKTGKIQPHYTYDNLVFVPIEQLEELVDILLP